MNKGVEDKDRTSSMSQKRPMNAFLIFCKRHRSVVKQKYPHLENRSITKILGKWWAALDGEAKGKYTELARSYKEAFLKANPNFRWYKTDFKIPTVLQPPSPPQTNLEATTPSPPPQPQPGQVGENSNLANQATGSQNSNTSISTTPKPPKKRYLESLENRKFKGSSNSTGTPISPSTASTSPPHPGGPPILDIDTMNRVIESALGGGSPSSSSSSSPTINHLNQRPSNEPKFEILGEAKSISTNSSPSTPPSKSDGDSGEDDSDGHNLLIDNARDTPLKCAPSLLEASTQLSLSPTTTISTSSTTTTSSNNPSSGEKPLNLSPSKVLHTSNQQIIDHFIDKLLGTCASGKHD